MKYIMALDQGTTSSRALIYDMEGRCIAVGQHEFQQYFPSPGLVEHDPDEIWTSQFESAEDALRNGGLSWSDISAIGITNQRETVIVWDRETARPVYPAIVWQDRRTAARCEEIKRSGQEPLIRAKTGLLADAYFSGTKIAWILDELDPGRSNSRSGQWCAGTVDSWLVYKLTGHSRHITDATNSSRTMLYNLEMDSWDDELMTLLDVPRQILPEIVDSIGIAAWTDPGITGGVSIPISGIGGDQQAALFGQGCHDPGSAKNTYGTGCFFLMHTGSKIYRSNEGLLTTVACREAGKCQYALEGSVFIAGAAVQWLRDQMGLISSAAETAPIASALDSNGGVYFVPAFTGLGTPYWNMYARGTIVGLTRGTGSSHIVRAALESIAYQNFDLVQAMENTTGIKLQELRVDGGAASNDFLMQYQADMLQIPVKRTTEVEATARGAAWMAGIGAGLWTREQFIGNSADTFSPVMDPMGRDKLISGWQQAVRQTLAGSSRQKESA